MLQTIDQALAGAIDIVADDISAKVKSCREQGVKATFSDAVQDVAGKVAGGAGAAIGGVFGRNQQQKTVSGHSGVTSGYADLFSGRGAGSSASGSRGVGGGAAFPYDGGHGGAAFQYAPPSRPSASSSARAGGAQDFAPVVGIQRSPAGAQFPPPSYGPPPGAFNAEQPAPQAATGKEPTVSCEVLAARIAAFRQQEAANARCFDCDASSAEWSSLSFGILVCIECSGHHRQMGTHISRVRSCKMDSWTERQLRVFEHGGNRRLAEFFAANGIEKGARFQRYQTPAAAWYREAWIKGRMFDQEVSPPPAGVVAGPCSIGGAAGGAAAAAPMDLLDMGASSGTAAPASAAAQGDLLGFDDGPAAAGGGAAPRDADLLGAAAPAAAPLGGGDLLGLDGGGGASSSGGLLDFGAQPAAAAPPRTAPTQTPLVDFTDLTGGSSGSGGGLFGAPAPSAALGGAVAQASCGGLGELQFGAGAAFGAPAAQPQWPQPVSAMYAPGAGMASTPWAAPAAPSGGAAWAAPVGPSRGAAQPPTGAGGTLGSGAKFAEPPKDEAEDPFGMALKKWGM